MRTRPCFVMSILMSMLVFYVSAAAAATASDESQDILKEYERFYERVDLPGWEDGSPDIIEFYSYNCSVCLQAEPFVARLRELLPADVSFEGQVVATGEMSWQLSQYAFTAARLAGVESRMHAALFDWLHVQHRDLESKEDVSTFFAHAGLLDAVGPFLESQPSRDMRNAIFERAVRYGINSTPTFVVNGRYRVRWGTDQEPDKFAALLIALAQKSKDSRPGTFKPPAHGRCGAEMGCSGTPARTGI